MIIKAIEYQLEKHGEWLSGLSIECDGNMNNVVIDKDGNNLEKDKLGASVYNLRDDLSTFCINTDKILNKK